LIPAQIEKCFLYEMEAKLYKGKGKGKFNPRTGHEGLDGEYGYSSTLSLTSVLNRVGGQHNGPADSPPPPRERPGTHCIGGWVGPRGPSGRVQKISFPQGFDPRTVKPVASLYTARLYKHFKFVYTMFSARQPPSGPWPPQSRGL
jgi:hypothetical protein